MLVHLLVAFRRSPHRERLTLGIARRVVNLRLLGTDFLIDCLLHGVGNLRRGHSEIGEGFLRKRHVLSGLLILDEDLDAAPLVIVPSADELHLSRGLFAFDVGLNNPAARDLLVVDGHAVLRTLALGNLVRLLLFLGLRCLDAPLLGQLLLGDDLLLAICFYDDIAAVLLPDGNLGAGHRVGLHEQFTLHRFLLCTHVDRLVLLHILSELLVGLLLLPLHRSGLFGLILGLLQAVKILVDGHLAGVGIAAILDAGRLHEEGIPFWADGHQLSVLLAGHIVDRPIIGIG